MSEQLKIAAWFGLFFGGSILTFAWVLWKSGRDAQHDRRLFDELADTCTNLTGERATLADWIAEALCVLEQDAEGDDAKRLLIEQGNALVVAVRGGDVPATDFGNNGPAA